MSSMGRPPTPPLALISSTAISMESFAVWPHSAPLPVNDAMQPILTLRPESFCASPFSVDATNHAQDMMATTASDAGSLLGTLIALHLPEISYPEISYPRRAPLTAVAWWNPSIMRVCRSWHLYSPVGTSDRGRCPR